MKTSRSAYRGAAILLTAGIFAIDTFTTLGIAIAVLYTTVVILSATFLERRGVLIVGALCTVLTLVSFLLTHFQDVEAGAVVRCAISLCAIILTTFLTLRILQATAHLSNQAALLELTHDAIYVRDRQDVITYWNRGAEELYGWPAADALGRNAAELLRTRFPLPLSEIDAGLRHSGRWEGEVVQSRRDGMELTVISRWAQQRGAGGERMATMVTNTDISERKRAEDALLRTQAELSHVARIVTLGELTASIAHEINQPLAAVVTNGDAGLRWLSREPPNIDAVRLSVEKMIANGRRASDVVARLRALARRSMPEFVPLALNGIVDDVLLLVQREVNAHHIRLDLALAPTTTMVLGDRVQLQQVLINLIINAIQAMADVDGRERVLAIRTGREAGDDGEQACIDVADSGVGLDGVDTGKIFAAFYSTKQDGMGMGLSVCRSIVEAHHGRIGAVANRLGGATFQVRLPVAVEGSA